MDRRNWTIFCTAGCLVVTIGLLVVVSRSRDSRLIAGRNFSSAQFNEIPVQTISRRTAASSNRSDDMRTVEIPRIPGTTLAERVVTLSPADSSHTLIVGNLADCDSQRQFQVTIVRLGSDDDVAESPANAAIPPAVSPKLENTADHVRFASHSSRRKSWSAPNETNAVGANSFLPVKKYERTFFLHTGRGDLDQPSGYELLKTELLAEGTHCRIWRDVTFTAEDAEAGSTSHDESTGATWLAVADPLVAALESEWGPWRDVDADGKLGIVLTPRLQQFRGGQTALKGLVNPNDWEPAVPRPFGNAADVVYVSPTLETASLRRTILAHELCHAWLSGQRATAKLAPEEDWLNEGLAHWCELRRAGDWANLDYRASRYFNEPERYPLVVPNYYHSPYWRDHGCRGAGFLFLQFLTETHGDELVRRLIAHPRAGMAKCAELCQQPFDELFRDWTIWLAGWEARECLAADDLLDESTRESTIPAAFPHAYRPFAAGRFLLAGPRPHELCLEANSSAEAVVTIRGSAAAFFQLHGGLPGRYLIRVEALPHGVMEPFQATLVSQPRREKKLAEQRDVSDHSETVLVWEQHDRDFHACGLLPGEDPPCAFSAQPVRHVVSRADLPVVVKQLRLQAGRLTCQWMTLAAADPSTTITAPIPMPPPPAAETR